MAVINTLAPEFQASVQQTILGFASPDVYLKALEKLALVDGHYDSALTLMRLYDGEIYEVDGHDIRVDQNPDAVFKWAQIASALDESHGASEFDCDVPRDCEATMRLGQCYAEGTGVDIDIPRGLSLMHFAVSQKLARFEIRDRARGALGYVNTDEPVTLKRRELYMVNQWLARIRNIEQEAGFHPHHQDFLDYNAVALQQHRAAALQGQSVSAAQLVPQA